eukprot:1670184-Prymnesium_polylepis.1
MVFWADLSIGLSLSGAGRARCVWPDARSARLSCGSDISDARACDSVTGALGGSGGPSPGSSSTRRSSAGRRSAPASPSSAPSSVRRSPGLRCNACADALTDGCGGLEWARAADPVPPVCSSGSRSSPFCLGCILLVVRRARWFWCGSASGVGFFWAESPRRVPLRTSGIWMPNSLSSSER